MLEEILLCLFQQIVCYLDSYIIGIHWTLLWSICLKNHYITIFLECHPIFCNNKNDCPLLDYFIPSTTRNCRYLLVIGIKFNLASGLIIRVHCCIKLRGQISAQLSVSALLSPSSCVCYMSHALTGRKKPTNATPFLPQNNPYRFYQPNQSEIQVQ